MLDTEFGGQPATITRLILVPVSVEQLNVTLEVILGAVGASLGLLQHRPASVSRRVTDELTTPSFQTQPRKAVYAQWL